MCRKLRRLLHDYDMEQVIRLMRGEMPSAFPGVGFGELDHGQSPATEIALIPTGGRLDEVDA